VEHSLSHELRDQLLSVLLQNFSQLGMINSNDTRTGLFMAEDGGLRFIVPLLVEQVHVDDASL